MALWATVDIVALGRNVTCEQVLLVDRISYLGASFVPPTFLYFALSLVGRPMGRLGTSWFLISGLLAILGCFTPLVVADIRLRPFAEVPGPLYPLVILSLASALVYGFWILLRALKTGPSYSRNQIRYVLFATLAGLTAVIVFVLVTYRLDVPPVHYLMEVVVACIFAYAIVRHRLMDITVAVTRTTIFAVVYAAILGVPLLLALAYQQALESELGSRWWISLWAVCAFLATVAHYTNAYWQGRAEARLLREQKRYQATLSQASQGMTQVRDLGKLLRLIVHVVTKSVQLTHGAIFLKTWQDNAYEVKVSRDKAKIPLEVSLLPLDPLIGMLQDSEGPVVTDELEFMAGQGSGGEGDNVGGILVFLRQHEIALVVPSFIENQLLGFLVLGPKRSGQPFTQDDINIFTALANQAALAVENALFFEELKTTQAQLFQSEKLATMGQLASSMAHEIHNPLAVISGEAQLLPASRQERDAQTSEFLNDIVKQCKRAEEITDRLLNFSRGAKNTKPEPLNLNEVLAESLKFVEHQVKMENVAMTQRLAEKLPPVLGNRVQIQEIFLNLLLNACQAMKGKEGASLDVATRRNDRFVEVSFKDTGPGIAPEHLRRIFDPFFTTKATGTGLGLFICDRIIREHQGKIAVESAIGKGTTFIVRLPIVENGQDVARSEEEKA